MAPIAHFNQHQSSFSGDVVPINIKKLNDARRSTHLDNNRSAAVEFTSFRWKSVINRPHYTMNEDGTSTLVEPQSTHLMETSNDGGNQTTAPIQEIESSSSPALNTKASIKKSSSFLPSKSSDAAKNKAPASPPMVNRFYKSRTAHFNQPLVSRCSVESPDFWSEIGWDDNAKYDTDTDEDNAIILEKVNQLNFLINAYDAEIENFKLNATVPSSTDPLEAPSTPSAMIDSSSNGASTESPYLNLDFEIDEKPTTSAPIEKFESSFGPAHKIEAPDKNLSPRLSPKSSGAAKSKVPAPPPIVNRLHKSIRMTDFDQPSVTRCPDDEQLDLWATVCWNDDAEYDTDTDSSTEKSSVPPSSDSDLDAEIAENNAIILQKVNQLNFLIDAYEAQVKHLKQKDEDQQAKIEDIYNDLTSYDTELMKCYDQISDLENEVTTLKGNLESVIGDRDQNISDHPLTVYVTRQWHDKEMEDFALLVTKEHNKFLENMNGCTNHQAATLTAQHNMSKEMAERDRIISHQRNEILMLKVDLSSVTDAHDDELTERDRMISILTDENETLRGKITVEEASHDATNNVLPSKPPKTPFRTFKSKCSNAVRQTHNTLRRLFPLLRK